MMKDWMTIGQLAKKTGLTARTIRLYEEKGLLSSHTRGDNEYRFYSQTELDHALQVKEFRDLGFTISEVADLLRQDAKLTAANLKTSLAEKLMHLKSEQTHFIERIQKLETLIASFNQTHSLSESQRRIVMEELVIQAKEKMKARGLEVSSGIEHVLRNEVHELHSPQSLRMMELLDIIKTVADEMNIKLGPGRGPAAGSFLLYSKGFNHNSSLKFDLLPELFYQSPKPLLWVDVEYDSAMEFLNSLLKRTTLEALRSSNIFIFQCPFLTILNQVESEVGSIDFDSIPDDSEDVLAPFHTGRAQEIFCFDAPEKSIMHANGNLEFWQKENGLKRKIWELLRTYEVQDADDILNLCTLSFPVGNKEAMLEAYVQSDSQVSENANYPVEVKSILRKTRGLLLYREDYIRVLRLYLKWAVSECNEFYQFKNNRRDDFKKLEEYNQHVPKPVRELLEKEAKSVFLKSHMVCMWWFIKRSAILLSRHPEVYKKALAIWQKNHHSAWSDLGFIDKDYRPFALYF